MCDTPEPRRNLQEDRLLPARSLFFHPDCHCRLRSCTESALRLVGYTTGRELHPALKSFDSIVWWRFSNLPLQALETVPARTAKRKAPNTRFRARQRHARTLAQQKTPERTFIPEQSSNTQEDTLLPARSVFFHPDYTVGFGIAPNHALRLVGYTTGRESHPALKTVSTCLRCDDSTSRRRMQYPSAKKDETGTLRGRESRYGKDRRKNRRSWGVTINLRTSVLPRLPQQRAPQELPLQERERVLRR